MDDIGKHTFDKNIDEYWMRAALAQADKASQLGEIPIGAIVVQNKKIVGVGHNDSIGSTDPTAHAEVVALRDAAQKIGNYRLSGLDLYVTIEPCMMCAGALVWARINRVVFGAKEPKTGALASIASVLDNPLLTHHVKVTGGILAAECAAKVKNFFGDRR
jgi:tRNA(adenine34) deaminase